MRREADRFDTDRRGEREDPDFRGMVETIPHLVWQSNPLGDWIWASPQWAAFTGQSPSRSRGNGWLDAVHPEDRERMQAAWRAASRLGHLAVEHRLSRRPAQAGDPYLWFSTQATPRRGEDGQSTTWFGTSTDIHALTLLRMGQERLIHELQRQGRNNLAVIHGIVRRVADTAATAEEAVAYIGDRLAAMARIQAEVSREPLVGVPLDVLIRDEFCAHALLDPSELAGPPVRLPAETAEELGLALHELVLGAVLDGDDRIAVTWTVTGSHLVLTWRTRARPGASAEGIRNLSAEMLKRMLAYDLHAVTTVTEIGREREVVIVLPLPQ